MDLPHSDNLSHSGDVDDLASVSEYADPCIVGIASAMRDHLANVAVSDVEWQRRHNKRLSIVSCIKKVPLYRVMAILKVQPGVFGNAPVTPNAYDRIKSKRLWESECMGWRNSINEKSCCFAAWKWSLLLARAPNQLAQACGLGGSVRTEQCLAHEHVAECARCEESWHTDVESNDAKSNDAEFYRAGDRAFSYLSRRGGLQVAPFPLMPGFIAPTRSLSEAEQRGMMRLQYRKSVPTSTKGSQPGTRYVVSIYSLCPAHQPDARDIICIMSFKGMLSDEGLRAFIIEHIRTATPPELKLGPREEMHAMMFLAPTSDPRLPAFSVCERLRCFCDCPTATRFEHPLIDGNMTGYWKTIGFVSLKHGEWQKTRADVHRLSKVLFAEEWKQRGDVNGICRGFA